MNNRNQGRCTVVMINVIEFNVVAGQCISLLLCQCSEVHSVQEDMQIHDKSIKGPEERLVRGGC